MSGRKTILVRSLWAATILVWAGALILCAQVLLHYENAPGNPGHPSQLWPSATRLNRSGAKYSLVMLVHPDCPCTQASLSELERIMAQLHGGLAGFVVFRKPASQEQEVRASTLWRRAAAIPDVVSLYDGTGAEIDRFGGSVSGQTMLYDPQGRLVFQGGITGARGHEGDNAGMDSILHWVRGESPAASHNPVFGCSLRDPGPQMLSEEPAWKKE